MTKRRFIILLSSINLVIILLLSLFALGFNAFLTNRKGQVQGASDNASSLDSRGYIQDSLVIDFEYDNSRIFLAQKQDHKAKVLKYSEIDEYDLLFEFGLSNIELPLASQIDRREDEIFYIEENLGEDVIYSQELNKRKAIFSTSEQIKSLKFHEKYIYVLVDSAGLKDEYYDYKLLKIDKLGISHVLVRFESKSQLYIDLVSNSSIGLRDIGLRDCSVYFFASEELLESKCQPGDASGVYEDFFVINKYSKDKDFIKPTSYIEIKQDEDDSEKAQEEDDSEKSVETNSANQSAEKNQYMVYKRQSSDLIVADDVSKSELIYTSKINRKLTLLYANERYLFLVTEAMETEEEGKSPQRQLIRVELTKKDKDTGSHIYDAANIVKTDDFDYLGISDNNKYLMFNFYNREEEVRVNSFYIYDVTQGVFYEASSPSCDVDDISCSFVAI